MSVSFESRSRVLLRQVIFGFVCCVVLCCLLVWFDIYTLDPIRFCFVGELTDGGKKQQTKPKQGATVYKAATASKQISKLTSHMLLIFYIARNISSYYSLVNISCTLYSRLWCGDVFRCHGQFRCLCFFDSCVRVLFRKIPKKKLKIIFRLFLLFFRVFFWRRSSVSRPDFPIFF